MSHCHPVTHCNTLYPCTAMENVNPYDKILAQFVRGGPGDVMHLSDPNNFTYVRNGQDGGGERQDGVVRGRMEVVRGRDRNGIVRRSHSSVQPGLSLWLTRILEPYGSSFCQKDTLTSPAWGTRVFIFLSPDEHFYRTFISGLQGYKNYFIAHGL